MLHPPKIATPPTTTATFTIGADKTVLLGPPFTFNSSNINNFNF